MDKSPDEYLFLFISPLLIIGRSGISLNKNRFTKKNVKEIKVPLSSYNFSLHIVLLPVLMLLCIPILGIYAHRYKPQVIHCRNLLSSFIAIFVKKIFHFDYKIISDPRSVYPEEGVIIKRWKINRFNYNLWKKLESYTFKNVNCCIGLSEGFTSYLKRFNSNSVYIPALVDDSKAFDPKLCEEKKIELNINSNDLVFIYVGSIGLWHDIDSLITMFYGLKKTHRTYSCKIIALSSSKQLKNRLQEEFGDDCLFCSPVNPNLVSSYMHLADFGLVPGSCNTGFHYDLLYDTMISSKAEEYICAGLPIICNNRIIELCKYIDEYDIGYTFNFKTNTFNSKKIYNLEDRTRISQWGLQEFGLKSVITKLSTINL